MLAAGRPFRGWLELRVSTIINGAAMKDLVKVKLLVIATGAALLLALEGIYLWAMME